jgi:hypothetical protein
MTPYATTAYRKGIKVRDMVVRAQKYVKGRSSKVDMTKLGTSQLSLRSKVLGISQCPICRRAGAFTRLYLA